MTNKKTLSIIFITVFIDLLGFGVLIPILPTFATKEIGISEFQIGVIVAIFSLMQFIFNPILGSLSDKIGRKLIIVSSLLLTSFSYLIFSITDSFFLLIISRMLAGIGGSNIGVAQAYIADITTKENRSKGMGMIGGAFGLGFVFGPLIGGFLSEFGYSIIGYVSASFSFLAFLVAFIYLPETKWVAKSDKIRIKLFDWKSAVSVLKIQKVGFLIFLFSSLIFAIANIYGTFALIGFKYYGFSDQQNGILFGISGLVGALIQVRGLKILSKNFREKELLSWGIFLMGIGLLLIPHGINFIGVAVIIAIMSIGTGLLQPILSSMISKYAPEHKQGEVLGVSQSISAFARVLGPLWGGWSFEYVSFSFPFYTGALVTLITLLIFNKIFKEETDV